MAERDNFDLVNKSDYCGRILKGDFSESLKKKLSDYIAIFEKFNTLGSPVIPYISAWLKNSSSEIWFEFAGTGLLDLLNCSAHDAARIFGSSVITRCSFNAQAENDFVRENLSAEEVSAIRQKLRWESQEKGAVEAVYQLVLPSGTSVWLKDQATVKHYESDEVFLSLGFLTFVTREMNAAELKIKKNGEQHQYKILLENQIRQQNKKIWQLQLDIMYRLTQVSELRDATTGYHITKIGHYCRVLGKSAGIRGNKLKLLYYASPLHDVGKIGIAESILKKPAKLTPFEFEQMKNHTMIGAKLLSGNNSDLLKIARMMALSHHERWDGSGYPFGLSRQQIPLVGRIVSICDVFDALTSERPYKKACRMEASIAEIEKGRGKQFDPQLADLFLRNIPAIKKVQEQFN